VQSPTTNPFVLLIDRPLVARDAVCVSAAVALLISRFPDSEAAPNVVVPVTPRVPGTALM
jgi:hypothetical protein